MGRRKVERGAAEAEGLGLRLRKLRQERDWTLHQLADRAQVAVGHLSDIERGRANVTVSLLKRICDGLDVTVGSLLEDRGDGLRERVTVTRRNTRKRILLPGIGIANELLTPDLRGQLEIIWVSADAEADSGGHPHRHEGEECGVVLSGRMEFRVGSSSWLLEPGDSIYLNSADPHSWVSCGPDRLEAIWVITPPSF